MRHRSILLILIFLVFPFLLFADSTPVLQRTGKQFDSSVPTIQSVLGYDFGERITRHSEMEKYIEALSKSSSKIQVRKIGETYEHRSLYYVILSSSENMTRLEELRQANLRLSDPRSLSAGEAGTIIANNPVFVGLSYSVHGDEHSGVEAALAMIYYLLASNDVETQEILHNCVIVIDPMQNPDGRERFINHFTSRSGVTPNPDRNAAEHNQNWPGGRTNHYLFDMNRDWTVLSQQETRARIQAYRQFQPQVYIDAHEMGSNRSYFFPPPGSPQNPSIPKTLPGWWKILGKAVASEFDRNGIEYFTSEGYDFWYPGYGDSWPTYNGALAGTFEQGSVRGLVVRRNDEVTVHYQDAIWHHFLSSLATCRMASANRQEKLQDFYDFRFSAIQEGKTGPVKQYILSRAYDPLETDFLIEKLLWQGIEVRQAQSDFSKTVRVQSSDRTETRNFKRGDYIIAMDQPLKRLIQITFEKEQPFDQNFLEAEKKRKEEDEPSEIYDITAWSLPLAYGLDGAWSPELPPSDAALLQQVPPVQPPVRSATYAYLLDYDTNQDLTAVIDLLSRDTRIYFSAKPFTLSGKNYRAGTFIIKVKDNPKELQQILAGVSQRTGVAFDSTDTGWTEEGPDLGSDDIAFLKKPKVAVLTDVPTDANSYGAIAYLFDQRYHLSYTALQTFSLDEADLKPYSVIIMPTDGWYTYGDVLDSSRLENLLKWVQGGGTLIALQDASKALIDSGKVSKMKRIKRYLKDSTEVAPEKDPEKKDDQEEEKATESPDFVIGSIARVKLYRKHFLTFGYDSDEIPVFVNSSNVLVTPPGMKAAASYVEADRLKMAGLFWDITKKRLEKKAYLTEESVGEGHVILFAEDPNFRAYWEGLSRLFMNGVLFAPSVR